MWITVEIRLKSVDNRGGVRNGREGIGMRPLYTHTYPPFIHTLYKANPRSEQGVYPLPTDNRSSYYDYLYIHTSSYANNLSTPTFNYMNHKSRG